MTAGNSSGRATGKGRQSGTQGVRWDDRWQLQSGRATAKCMESGTQAVGKTHDCSDQAPEEQRTPHCFRCLRAVVNKSQSKVQVMVADLQASEASDNVLVKAIGLSIFILSLHSASRRCNCV